MPEIEFRLRCIWLYGLKTREYASAPNSKSKPSWSGAGYRSIGGNPAQNNPALSHAAPPRRFAGSSVSCQEQRQVSLFEGWTIRVEEDLLQATR
jgi:hypothetical protein